MLATSSINVQHICEYFPIIPTLVFHALLNHMISYNESLFTPTELTELRDYSLLVLQIQEV